MTRTAAEIREYSRGYQRGTARVRRFADFAFRFAKGYREKLAAVQAEKFGRDNWTSRQCQTCERWTRGQPGNCKWGHCSADFRAEAGEPRMWGDGQITTHEDFACCNHLLNNYLRKARGTRTKTKGEP